MSRSLAFSTQPNGRQWRTAPDAPQPVRQQPVAQMHKRTLRPSSGINAYFAPMGLCFVLRQAPFAHHRQKWQHLNEGFLLVDWRKSKFLSVRNPIRPLFDRRG